MMTYSEPEFIFYPQLNSSNTELKRLISKKNLAEHSVVITAEQIAGRGQVGNSWESEKNSNLTFSTILRPTFLQPHLQFYISKLVSLAIIDTIKYLTNEKVCVKWPNDIYINDNKVAGILIENSILGNKLEYSIIGIGLNVNQKQFCSDAPNPISLKNITDNHYDLEPLLEELLDNIKQRYEQLLIDRKELINNDYLSNLYRSDAFYSFKDKNGLFEARIASINEIGFLSLLDKNQKVREYAFKEVSFVI